MFKNILTLALILAILPSVIWCDSNNYSFQIMEDSELNTTVYINASQKEGRTLLVIGGVHGDEPAGIKVGEKLSKQTPSNGTLIVIPKANAVSCANNNRTEYYMEDLNRSFMGSENDSNTQKLAWEIVKLINKYKPALIIDLHESRGKYSESCNFIGQSIILSDTQNTEPIEIAFEILDKVNSELEEELWFTVLSGAPGGSINSEISKVLDIPVITIETSMNQELEQRVTQQIYVIDTILNYYGMDD